MAELRDLLGTSRKYAVPIGEYLDRVAHNLDEFEDTIKVDAEAEISAARRNLGCVQVASEPPGDAAPTNALNAKGP